MPMQTWSQQTDDVTEIQQQLNEISEIQEQLNEISAVQEMGSSNAVEQLPVVPIPSGAYLLGKEQIFGIPPLSALPKRYQTADDSDKFALDDYLIDSCCALAPKEMFKNITARHVLAKVAVTYFEKYRYLFFNKQKQNKISRQTIIFLIFLNSFG